MYGVMGGLSHDRGVRGEIQPMLAVVSGVLATDQIVKWVVASNAGVDRILQVVPWMAAVSITALVLSAVALLILLDARMLSAPVVGLMLGGLSSAVIDTFAGPGPVMAISIADVAVTGAVSWWAVTTVLTHLAWREPVFHARRHRLAA